eukprot:g42493.t1
MVAGRKDGIAVLIELVKADTISLDIVVPGQHVVEDTYLDDINFKWEIFSNHAYVLLMGKSGSGKTSMRSIIFANYIARDTRRLAATIDVEHSHVRFLGNLVLNLWDCGGQDTFMENYFTSQRDNIFRNVEVLIYVFDVESRELEKDMHYYQSCLEAILQNSPDAKIFCLVHKMDLVQEDQRDLIFKEREDDLRRLSRPLECTCFRTSIWDETLYK